MTISKFLIVFFVTTTRIKFLDAFTVLPATQSRHAFCRQQVQDVALLMASSSSEEQEQDEEKRMEMVRMLQKTFYSSSEEDEESRVSTATRFEESTGRMLNLPLWRVGWVEVPGRSNCLNVHEGHYTNMFEKILRDNNNEDDDNSPTSRYFGHIYLPGGTKASRTDETRFQLKDWQQEIDDLKRFDEKERSSVVGCLMRITDYRRLKDGRLVLLVQALERFVVDTVIESFPHGVAHVQLLPDIEDTLSSTSSEDVDENFGKISRAKAIRQSFKYHDYECDPSILLPLPKDSQYMSAQDVFGSAIAKCLPFCYYAQDDSMLDKFEQQPTKEEEDCDDQGTSNIDETKISITSEAAFAGGQPLLENRLQADLILRDPPPLPGVARRQTDDIDSIEKLFWLALEDFCRNYQFRLPDEILCLMPPDMADYLDLERSEHPISVKYPVRRRQRRLSYAVPRLIENFPIGSPTPTRQILLAAPGTRARLLAVLERFEYLNNAALGQFE